MISFIVRNKRPIIALLLATSFLISGAFIITTELINTGGLFFYTPIVIFVYVPFFWWKSPTQSKALQSWNRREIWALTLWVILINGVGVIESIVYDRIIWILFLGVMIAYCIFLNKYFNKNNIKHYISDVLNSLSTIIKWFSTINICSLIGLMVYAVKTEITDEGQLVLLENDKDLIETLIGTLLFVFIFFMVSWLVWQIKSIMHLKSEKKKTEVLHLQSQVNPHFFFNMLNNLYGLVEEDPQKAQALILKLSDMMRYSIYDGQQDRVTIFDEIEYLKNYIALHKMRYHKAIDIQFTTDIQEKGVTVMPLLFMLLLENAFKHGVENLSEDAYINMHIQSLDGKIYFTITNNYDATQQQETVGIGLKNLKRRLALVYPKKHTLTFEITQDVYTANLMVPSL